MNRRIKAVLLIVCLAVAAPVVTVGALTKALARVIDPTNYCETGFSRLSSCTMRWSKQSVYQSTPIFATPSDASSVSPSRSPEEERRLISVDVMSWAVAQCPESAIARRLLCASGTVASAATDDVATGWPRPKPWVLTMAKNSTFIEAVHVETPLDLAAVLGFYRDALTKRGWTENDGAVVAPDAALIAFTTADGPALLRLTRQNERTVADLSRRKPAVADASIQSKPGQARLRLGNSMDEEAIVLINEQPITLAAKAGDTLRNDPKAGAPDIDLLPGKYKVTLKSANGAAQNGELVVAADETWGLVAGPDGVPLPVRLY